MKFLFTICFMIFLIEADYAQKDNIKAIADSAVKTFTWDIQKAERGSLMFLDIPYQRDNQDSVEYLTLTIAKDTSQKRPDFISIIIPNNIVQSNGIFIKFATSVRENGNW